MTQITSNIWVGGVADARKKYDQFDLILNVSEVSLNSLISKYTGVLIQIPLIDDPSFSLGGYLPYTNAILERADKDNKRILINCYRGISRSVSILIGYLMQRDRVSYGQALDRLRKQRKIANPNIGFQEQLIALQRR